MAKASWQVLVSDRELTIFTALGALFTLIAAALFAFPAIALVIATNGSQPGRGNSISPAEVLLLFAFYLVISFITVFFNTALIGAALQRLRGEHPSVHDGFQIAIDNLGHIFVFALISATVGVILALIEEKFKFVGQIVASIAGGAWGIVTFLVIPVMVAEGCGPFTAIKRSGQLLRQTWGEQIAGSAGIGFIFFLLALLAVIPIGLGVLAHNAIALLAGIAIGVIYLGIVFLISSALNQIFRAAVYLYTQTGTVPAQFEGWMLKDAFKAKKPAV